MDGDEFDAGNRANLIMDMLLRIEAQQANIMRRLDKVEEEKKESKSSDSSDSSLDINAELD